MLTKIQWIPEFFSDRNTLNFNKMKNNSLSYKDNLMQRGCVEAKSVTHNYYNSSTKPKFYKNTRLAGKIIEKTSLTNFY